MQNHLQYIKDKIASSVTQMLEVRRAEVSHVGYYGAGAQRSLKLLTAEQAHSALSNFSLLGRHTEVP
jgi:hypothetical protein